MLPANIKDRINKVIFSYFFKKNILTISSGIIQFNLTSFVFICILTRGLRFFLVAFLTYKFGSKFGPFLEKKGGQWATIIAVIIIVITAGIYLHIF